MSVDIGRAIEEGARRTIARNGLYLVAIAWVLGILNGLFGNTMARNVMDQVPGGFGPGMGQPPMGPTLGLSSGVAGLLSLLVGLVTAVVIAAAIRTFVTDDTETLPESRFTRNLGWMLVNLVIGGIVFGIVVAIGFVLLVIPGLFLLVSLIFWNVYVVEEDENFVEAFQSSWALTGGNRIMLFVLGVLVVIISAIVGGVFGIANVAAGGFAGLIVSQLGSAFGTIFGMAVLARTYVHLTEAGAAAE